MGWSPPQGPPVCETRGKTAPNRLRQVDAFVCAWAPGLCTRGAMSQTWVVDLGFGRVPRTTLGLAAHFCGTWIVDSPQYWASSVILKESHVPSKTLHRTIDLSSG